MTIENMISAFLLPPLNCLVLGGAGVMLLRRKPRSGKFLVSAALVLLYLFSTPFFAESLLQAFEPAPLTPDAEVERAQAIVVLGGGTYFHAPEYEGEHTVGQQTLERLRYAAYLHQLTGKPILVSGGDPLGSGATEAEQMKRVLQASFLAEVKWLEGASKNTRQNAIKSGDMLLKDGIKTILLVTHASHMPRSAQEFERVGFAVISAPTGFTTRYKSDRVDWLRWIPNARALEKSRILMHEVIGLLWYRLQ